MELKFLQGIWSASTPPSGKLLGGHYQVIQQLGAGGFGHTFLAKDLHLPGQPICVVKQLKPIATDPKHLQVARRLFDTEAQVLYRLGIHSQIPKLLAHFEEKNEFYLAQEWIDGNLLADELTDGAPWSEIQTVSFLWDVLKTLAFVHQHRVIHRDLKPCNLIRRRSDKRIVLIDFGAVKQVSSQIITPGNSMTQTISIGTEGYMPNEQIAGRPQFSSDIYAVGIMGIQSLTGRHPRTLNADPRTGEINWHAYAVQTDPTLIEMLDRMVRYDFRTRYNAATDVLATLKSLPNHLIQAIPDTDTESLLPSLVVLPSEGKINTAPIDNAADQLGKTLSDTLSATVPDSSVDTAGCTLVALGQQPIRSNPKTSIATELVSSVRSRYSMDSWRRVPMIATIAGLLIVGLVIGRSCATSTPSPTAKTSANERPIQRPSPVSSSGSLAPTPASTLSLSDRLQQADQLQTDNQHTEAVKRYDDIIAQDSEAIAAYTGRCYSLNKLQRYDEAIAACEQALVLDSTQRQALWGKGYALEQQGAYTEAIALYDQAIKHDSTFAEAWNNKGTTLLSLGDSGKAVDAFDEAIAINANFSEAWSNRGAALWDQRAFSQALSSVERALEIQPDNPDALQLRQAMKERLR